MNIFKAARLYSKLKPYLEMLENKPLSLVLKNWKTSLAGLIGIFAVTGQAMGWLTPDQAHGIVAVAVSFGLVMSKDFNITGGAKLLILAALLFGLSPAAHAQLIGPAAVDAPQHIFDVGMGANGNGAYHASAGWSERVAKTSYVRTGIDFIPSFVVLPSGQRTLSIKPVTTAGANQIILQSGRLTVLGTIEGGAALPSGNVNATNLAAIERVTFGIRTNKALRTGAGEGNHYIGITPSFIQIPGANSNTWQISLSYGHSMNGTPAQ